MWNHRSARGKLRTFSFRHAFLLRLLSTMLLACVIPLVILSAVNAYNKSEELDHQLRQQNEMVASSVASQFENCMDAILRLNARFSTDNSFINFSQFSSVSKERDFIGILENLDSVLPFVEDLGVYLVDGTKRLYATSGKYQAGIYASEVLHIERAALENALANIRDSAYIAWNSAARISVCLIPMRIYASSQTVAIGVYSFSHRSLSAFFQSALPAGYAISSIVAPDGICLYQSPFAPVASADILDGSGFSGIENGVAYSWGTALGDRGYRVAVCIPEEALMQSAASYSQLAQLFIFIAVAFCAILLALLITVNYMPILRLVRQIGGRADGERQDEFSVIYDAFSQRETEARQLKSALNQQRLMLMDYAYSRLLSGGKMRDEDLSVLSSIKTRYVVVAARLSEISDIDMILDQNSIGGEIYALELYRAGYLALVLRVGDDEERVLLSARELIPGIRAGTSDPTEELFALHARFEEAVRRLNGGDGEETTEEETIQEEASDDSALDETTSKLIAYVDEHFADPSFCVASAAQFLGVSEYTTGKLLRNVYGTNFRRIINEKRIALSKVLLMTTEGSVSDVGRQAGFMSTSYFIKVFKDSESVTPTQFRQLANDG